MGDLADLLCAAHGRQGMAQPPQRTFEAGQHQVGIGLALRAGLLFVPVAEVEQMAVPLLQQEFGRARLR